MNRSETDMRIAPQYIIMTSRAKMPSSCMGAYNYYHVAVVETSGHYPAYIGTHARGCRRIVWDSGAVFAGKTTNCAYWRAVDEAQEIIESL